MRHTFWRARPWFVLGSVIGVAIGGSNIVNIPPWLAQVGVDVFIIWSVLARPPRSSSRWPFATGSVSSFLTMFFGATGPFVATYSKSLTLTRHAHVATDATLMSVQHLLKSLVFGLLGFAFAPWAGFVFEMILSGILGTLTGNLVLNKMMDVRFHQGLNVVLLLIAARLVWSGISVGRSG